MNIGDATREYVKYKQALGQRFETEEVILRAFTNRVGRWTVVSKIKADQVLSYLGSRGKVTRF
jgi:integrase/recombinase XerD